MAKVDISSRQKISTASLSDLNDELSAMINAGIPLDEGLRNAAKHLRKDSRDFVERLINRTEQGSTLEEAIELESKKLPLAYLSLIKSGLRMGRLPEALTAYTSFSRSRIELRQEIGNALLYPAFVLIMAFLLSLFVCFVIFPELLTVHKMFQLETTPLLQFVYRLFEFYQIWYLIIPFAFCFLLFCWKSSRSLFLVPRDQKRPLGGKIISTIAYGWIPGYRNLIREMNYSTFTEMTSLLLSYNVPLTEAFTLAAESTGSSKVIADTKSLTNLLEQGVSLEEGIQSCRHFPVFIKTMIMEKTYQNHLPNILSEISRVYRTRILNRIDWLKNIIPVVLLIIVAGGITACYTIIVFLPFVEILKMLGSPTL
ncbi:type II secretion system F family protein [Gimesia aquarii]|uniref:Type II secretion system protein F n=1 Tax=Gimesia aquarii TaxID=2527964 RepID=A0A517VNY5_9PLAN|nr:type II secretion system F family protein [Gimesia aquarii]QDT94731.1 Type II secretion system protein F [Gimesia aquarii]